MEGKDQSSVADEIDSRLEVLFEEAGESTDSVGESGLPEDFPLRDLKATLLSIDWEITDEMMTTLVEEAKRLESEFQNDKSLLMFLRLLGSVGKYIRTNKANAHPGAIRLLNSVYNGLEKVLLSPGITTDDKKEVLLAQVREFNRLKGQIARRKAEKTREMPAGKGKTAAEGPGASIGAKEAPQETEVSRAPHEAFAYALDEIKEVIRAEFRALRAELKLWREGSQR
jgi:hypothetical protein